MHDWWIYVLLGVGGLLLLSWLVGVPLLAGWLVGEVVRRWMANREQPDHAPERMDDDVECPCCGLSRLETVRSTTGTDACPCCLRRPCRRKLRRCSG